MPGPSDDVPRWQPPSGPSEDVPRWEPPAPSSEVPRWQPPAADSRASAWEPSATVPRWQPPAGEKIGAVLETEAAERRAPAASTSPFALPFVWWGRHPWVVIWAAALLTPAAVLFLRVLDESGLESAVEPAQWTLLVLLAVILLRGVLFSARRSLARLALGLLGAGVTVAALLWPVTQVTLGRVTCPPRAGTDLGVQAAAVAIGAWQSGEKGAGAWRGGEPDAAWLTKASAISLLDSQLVESGCFERVAPIDATRTWHEFRVTVKEGERPALSKVVVVHTASESGEWKITGIEGPLP